MPGQKPEIVDNPQEQQRVVMAAPVSPVQYANDQRLRDRAARRRDPNARNDAQATLDAAHRLHVVLEPNEADRIYGESHVDAEGYPQYPLWTCTYNGIPLAYPVGRDIEMPYMIYEQYLHTKRRPAFRIAPGDPGKVFSREIAEGGVVDETPDFGR